MDRIYFDYASTTPTDPEVIQAMEPFWFERFGNASSPHTPGREASKALENARQGLARLIGAQPEEIVFTSGATESNNFALSGLARKNRERGQRIVVSRVEHHSVLAPAEALSREGFQVTYLDVDAEGLVDPQAVRAVLTDDTIIVCVMHASNEIGTIQPVAEIGQIIKGRGVAFLVDAVQTVGHIPVDVNELGADLLSLSAHKFYGPKGIGALYIRKGTPLRSFLLGGDQEKSRRASTQNVAGAVGLAKATELAVRKMREEQDLQTRLRDRLLTEIPQAIAGVKVNGHVHKRLPNNVHFSFEGIQGEALLMSLDMAGFAASMGSACTSGALEPSHVLRAIGLDDRLAYGALRITLGRWTTQEEVEQLIRQLPAMVEQLRS